MRRFCLVASLLLTGLVSFPGVSTAQDRSGRFRGDREALERQFRERLAAVIKARLGLTDEQMRQLSEVNAKYEKLRADLVRRDRANRLAMREELMQRTNPNQDRVNQLLLEARRLARERLDLSDAEQDELAKFLTPVQRAMYFGMQEQMRMQIERFRGGTPLFEDSAFGPRGRGVRRPPRDR
jgi:hypothetical protein